MILDAQCQLDDSAAPSTATTTVSAQSYDLGAEFVTSGLFRDVGIGEPLGVLINIEVSANIGDADETYAFEVIVDSTANLATAPVVIAHIGYTAAEGDLLELVAGKNIVIPIPSLNGHVGKRYLGIQCVTAGTTPGITYSAWIQPMSMLQQYRNYPAASVII